MSKKWGNVLIPLFFAMVPLDISKILFPPYASGSGSPTTLTFLRITMGLLAFLGLWSIYREKLGILLKRCLQTPIAIAIIPIFIAAAVSAAGSFVVRTTLVETARLVLLGVLGLCIAVSFQEEKTLRRVWQAIFLMATLTALFALLQYGTGKWIWGGGINTAGVRRVNSTFMDPNIFARYLNISLVGSLLLFKQLKWKSKWLPIMGIILQIAALGVTFSRTGWLIFLLALIFLLGFTDHKLRKGLLIVTGIVSTVALFIPSIRLRLLTLTAGAAALGQRQHLLAGAWAMFIEHPLTGVGLGNFQWALENKYHYLVPWSDAVTRSHTSVATIGAETGLCGLIALAIFLVAVIITSLKVKGYLRNYALAGMAGIMVIWLSSQGEGRFFEDPMVWGFWGLSIAMQWKQRVGKGNA